MNKRIYFYLQFKRVLKKYPSILIITLATLVAITLCATMILGGNKNGEEMSKIKVGVVGDTSDSFLNMGIDVIKSIDDSKYYIDIISMTKEQAEKAVKSEEIIGYVEIPENFVESIASMDNSPAVYYLPNRPESIGTSLAKEVMDTVAVYITESQKAVAGLSGYIRANKLEYGKSLDEISILLMTNVILQRNKLYTTEYTGIAGHISTGGYYLAGLLLFFIMLSGISCSSILTRKDYALERCLHSKGFGSTRQVLCEYMVYLAISIFTLLILACLLGIVISTVDTGIRELACAKITDCLIYIIRILPAILAITSMQFLMYEATNGIVAAILLQFLSAIILGYLSGCFYPNYFFPEALRKIIDILPPGVSFTYMRETMLGNSSPAYVFILAAYAVIFITAATIIRKIRLAGDAA